MTNSALQPPISIQSESSVGWKPLQAHICLEKDRVLTSKGASVNIVKPLPGAPHL
jgi:hypothetical protein